MGNIVLAVIGIVVAWLVVRGGLGLARFYDHSYRDRRAAADDFYKLADEILVHPQATADDIKLIENMNFLVNDPRTIMVLLEYWRWKEKNPSQVPPPVEPMREIDGLLLLAYDRWFAAVSRLSPMLGMLARVYRSQQPVRSTVNGTARKVQRKKANHRLAHA